MNSKSHTATDKLGDTSTSLIANRTVLLFVSSTFSDLQAERDELVANVFPRIRSYCRDRSVVFTEVDLRWGITRQQANDKEILSRCFHEIERCEPFFIGIIGDRYGWVPDHEKDILDPFRKQHAWLNSLNNTSVTEMEFLHGVFNRNASPDIPLFYSKHQPSSAVSETKVESDHEPLHEKPQLEALKHKLRQSQYPFREGFLDPKTLGQWIYDDMVARIDNLFPTASSNEKDSDSFRHFHHARQFTIGFSGRQKELQRISKLSKQRGRCVMILGEPGAGKSALLANWFQATADESDAQARTGWLAKLLGVATVDTIRIVRFAHLNSDDSSPDKLAHSIIREIKRRLCLKRSLPKDSVCALVEFQGWLEEAGALGKLLIMIDGIDNIESDIDRLRILLPSPAPPGVTFVASATKGDREGAFDSAALVRSGWKTIHLEPLPAAACCEMIERTLEFYGKQLDNSAAIAERSASKNPRFVRNLVEGIRVHGEFGVAGEKLDERIDWFLASRDEVDLYDRLIEKWQADFNGDRLDMVGNSLVFLLLSNNGLEERELLVLLGKENMPMAHFNWTPFKAASENVLVESGGKLLIPNPTFRKAIVNRFLSNPIAEAGFRQTLIDYFQSCNSPQRQIDELLWQWAILGDWHQICQWLNEFEHIERCWSQHEYVIKDYCRRTAKSLGVSIAEIFANMVSVEQMELKPAVTACRLLYDLSEFELSSHIISKLLDRNERLEQQDLRMLLSFRGSILLPECPERALETWKREELICRDLAAKSALAACLGNQAIAYRRLGDTDQAEQFHQQEQAIARDQNDLRMLAGSLSNETQLLIENDHHDRAQRNLKEFGRLANILRAPQLIGRWHECQGACYSNIKKYYDAAIFFEKAAIAFREAGDQHALALSLCRLAESQYLMGDLDSSIDHLDEAELVAKDIDRADLRHEFKMIQKRILSQFER